MQLIIMSSEQLEEYGTMESKYDSIVISIKDCNGEGILLIPNERNRIKRVLALSFNDTEIEDKYGGCITDSDIDKIYNFICDYTDKVDMIIVQCVKGQSRSAGVAKAIRDILEIEDKEIDRVYKEFMINESYKHKPNKLVYKKLMEKFEG